MIQLDYQSTMNQLRLHVEAGAPVIRIVSFEEQRVIDNIARVIRVIRGANKTPKRLLTYYAGYELNSWDLFTPEKATGDGKIEWQTIPGVQGDGKKYTTEPGIEGVLEPIRSSSTDSNEDLRDSITVLFDIQDAVTRGPTRVSSVIRALRATANEFRKQYASRQERDGCYKTLIIITPEIKELAPELEQDVITLEFPLPEASELRDELEAQHQNQPFDHDAGEEDKNESELHELVAGAGRGLPLEKYKGALNIFRVRDNRLAMQQVEELLRLKSEAVATEPALEFYPEPKTNLRGLEVIEEWIKIKGKPSTSEETRKKYHLSSPRGVLICGVSGGGKSELAKFIAASFGQALLRLDVGALFGKFVGDSESNTRRCLRLAESLAPVVLWLDEVDKAFAGLGTKGNNGDGGVANRVFSHFLTWMSDHQASVFMAATANDFEGLHREFPEFFRKGRFDEIFWVGVPTDRDRKKIFEVYLEPHTKLDAHESDEPESYDELGHLLQIRTSQLTALKDGLEDPKEYLLNGSSEFEQLCGILAHTKYSAGMTGAEIQYAVVEALYHAYHLDQESGSPKRDKLTETVIADCVGEAATRGIYRPGGHGAKELERLNKRAKELGWVRIGQ